MANYNIDSGSSAPQGYRNVDLNATGSKYAADYSHDLSILIEKATNKAIFDAAPQQYMDLKLLNMKSFIPVNSDEFYYQEMGYQRQALTVDGAVAAPAQDATSDITLVSVEGIAEDMIIVFSGGEKGIVRDIAGLVITVAPLTGETLPAVADEEVISVLSTVEGDGIEGFAHYFRATTVERHNYVQLFSKAIRYGEVELFKLQNAAATSNFLEMEKNAMFKQFRTDISNAFWNGDKGEVLTAKGVKAKVTQGLYPAMVAAGSPSATAVSDNGSASDTLQSVFEELVIDTEYGDYGQVRFAFMSPKVHLAISKLYKEEKTRYAPNDAIASLSLDEVNLGSSRIVFVPYSRFTDTASFPADWANKIILLDMKNINLRQMWAERSGETLDREGGIAKTYKEMYVDANMGVQFNNPLACGYIDVTFA